MQYDTSICQKYMIHAVTKVEDLEIGRIYYSNLLGEFQLLDLLTDREYGIIKYNTDDINADSILLQWMKIHSESTGITLDSLPDNNIGGSLVHGANYNPWMVFKDEDMMKAYKSEIDPTIWFEPDWTKDDYY